MRTRRTGRARWGSWAVLLGLAGCTLAPAYERPAVELPPRWEGSAATPQDAAAQDGDARWWHDFGSGELDALMGQALAANHDLGAAIARIDQARAAATIARAPLFPTVGATVDASRNRVDTSRAPAVTINGDQALLSASYELDLWGGNRAASSAASARLAASQADRDSVALVLQSDVAANYFTYLALRDRLDIASRNRDAAAELLKLVEVRFDNGAASALDVAQQRTTLLAISATIPPLEQSLRETRHALAVLLGRPPEGFSVQGRSLAQLTLPVVHTPPPVQLLERRPDVRTAEQSLIAANADIGAARAALLPSLGLSASAGLTNAMTGGVSGTVSTIAASLAQTIFAGGRLRAGVAFTEAVERELTESYVQSVLNGLREVEDSLSGVETQQRRSDLLAQTAQQARESYRLARIRYDAGADDLVTLLDSQRSQLLAEDGLVQAELARYTAAVSLYKALGGGW
jgi:outer membrane protein, multidrug efflux system